MRAAIAGLGRWGRAIVAASQGCNELRFVAAVEPDLNGARAFCAEHNIGLTDQLQDILSDKTIDAVFIVTPHSLHREQVLACAAAGKHVFCEKPLALKVEDARAMFAACRAANVKLAVGHNRRFWPSMIALRDTVLSGELGTLLHVEGHNSNENSKAVLAGWRLSATESPGGGLTGSGLHILDSMVAMLGRVSSVQALLATQRQEAPQLDTATAILKFASGMSGTLSTIRMTPYYWRVHVFGTDASAEVLGETSMILRKSGQAPIHREFPTTNTLRAEIDAFAAQCTARASYPVNEDEVTNTLAAFEGILASMRNGTAVEIK